MDENMNQGGDILNFVLPKNQSSYIKVMGVGGGGSNAVNHMYRQGIKGVDFIVCNTDAQALESSPVPVKIQLGKGLGAGNVPQVAKDAALEKHDQIKEVLAGTKMLFLTAGMGGGTGTGATPVVASIAKEIELVGDEVTRILTVAIVTTPFSFEGRKRIEQAKAGISELRKVVDAILVINNDQLRKMGKMTLMEAFAMADNVLTTAAKGISEIITVKSYVQIDFKDVNTVMHDSGVALMGFGTASGENRAKEAAEAAMDSPLLNDNSIKGAKNLLLYLSYGPDAPLNMDEIEIITQSILQKTGPEADMIWGAGEDENLGENLNITLIATGFTEKRALGERSITRFALDEADTRSRNEARNTANVRPVAERVAVKKEWDESSAKNRKVAVLTLDETDEVPVFVDRKAGEETLLKAAEPADMRVSGPEVSAEIPAAGFEAGKEIEAVMESWFNDMDVLAKAQEESSDSAWGNVPGNAEEAGLGQEEGCFGVQEAGEGISLERGQDASLEFSLREEEAPVRERPVRPAGETQAEYRPESGSPASGKAPVRGNVENLLQDRCEVTAERMRRLREMSQKIRTQQGLHEVESVPAFRRQNIEVAPVVPSDVSQAGHARIGQDGSLFSCPPFLSEKAD